MIPSAIIRKEIKVNEKYTYDRRQSRATFNSVWERSNSS